MPIADAPRPLGVSTLDNAPPQRRRLLGNRTGAPVTGKSTSVATLRRESGTVETRRVTPEEWAPEALAQRSNGRLVRADPHRYKGQGMKVHARRVPVDQSGHAAPAASQQGWYRESKLSSLGGRGLFVFPDRLDSASVRSTTGDRKEGRTRDDTAEQRRVRASRRRPRCGSRGARGLRRPRHADKRVHGAGARAPSTRSCSRASSAASASGRYSFLGVGDREVVSGRGHEVVVENGGVTRRVCRGPAARRRPRARRGASGARARAAALRRWRCRLRRLRDGFDVRARSSARQRRPRRAGLHASCWPTSSSPSTTPAASCRSSRRCGPGGAPDIAYDAALRAHRQLPQAHRRRAREAPSSAPYGVQVPVADGAPTRLASSSSRRSSAPRSTSRPATSSRSCSRSATRRRTKATGSTSTACCAP